MSDTTPVSPYLFVVGCPRSGTTLLQRMLDAHPQLAVANDTHFIPRAVEVVTGGSAERAASRPCAEQLIRWARSYHRFHRLGLDGPAVDAAAARAGTYPEFVSGLYRELARRHGKRLAGEKTPDYARHLPLLHRLFPDTKVIHIVRDGRDVALSTLEWAHATKGPGRYALWREEPVAVCALWWRWQAGRGLDGGRSLPGESYLEVRYENLVAAPEAQMRRLVGALDLPWADDVLEFNRGRVRRREGLSAKKAWLSPTPGLRDWRTQMDSRSVQLFEALAGDLLEVLGYKPSGARRSVEVERAAVRCRRWWEADRRRRWVVPDAWHDPGAAPRKALA